MRLASEQSYSVPNTEFTDQTLETALLGAISNDEEVDAGRLRDSPNRQVMSLTLNKVTN